MPNGREEVSKRLERLLRSLFSLTCKYLSTSKVLKFLVFKGHSMFRPIWPSSGVKKNIYLISLFHEETAAICCCNFHAHVSVTCVKTEK
jgi:hypothetical protein